MSKKRKASKLSSAKQDAPDQNSRFAADAQFADSEDEFEQGRDRVLLEEAPEAKRRRKLAEQEEFFQPSDEEVLGYQSESIDDEEFDDDDVDDEEEEEEEEDAQRSTLKKKSKLRLRDATSPIDDDEEGEGGGDEDEGMNGWGSSKKDYYDADVIETEADAFEEEAEAKKIQQQRLQAMNEADFGFDESEWVTSGKDGERGHKVEDNVVTEILPELQVTDNMSVDERRKILRQRYPEFEPISKDFLSLQQVHEELAAAAQNAENLANGSAKSYRDDDDDDYVPLPVVKFRALSAYLGAVSMYFSLLTSPSRNGEERLAMSPAELREHPIMETLINCKKQWEDVKDVQQIEDSEMESDYSVDEDQISHVSEPASKIAEIKKNPVEPTQVTKSKKTKAQKAAEDAQAIAEKKRSEKLRQTEAELADLSKLLDSRPTKKPSKQAKKSKPKDDDSDFGDETTLDALEAEEKAKKKKSLRFYTSQIAQKANKRDAAGRDAGGDTDLPHRERLKDRQARLNAQAEKRGHRTPDDLHKLGGDSDEDDHRLARDVRGDKDKGNGGAGSDSDDYYDMVAARSKQKKADKKKLAEAHAEAAREGGRVEIQEAIGEDGKRAITYAIEKNKGLTPKRNKDVRNPRVKKRKKYEEKKKKLGSIRQIYKGGEGRGGYGGELTGIKTNLVKSVKL
ncbi:U3 small nucleolar RNA-associated protein 3 [[Emmonsia] crescens]|uniref:U3 small nucleolar RNA-associated protein 3 n=1 Tax=[Emmonsia] crescens TaxID=73230 RepID=A0A2B7ZL86_9EURO|nr:U3 small nucleolar RNA-associated protein 3 [Emmonsia crescens]